MRSMTRMGWLAAAAAAAAGAAPPAVGQAPQDRGLEIAREADRRQSGFGDYSADLEMLLRNRQGQESLRRLRIRILEQKDDGDKGWVYFEEPADVKGTALLTFSHKTGNDDQWLFLPALSRVKRISSTNKTGPFMGSEFSYEDISSQEVEEYTYRYLRDEDLEGRAAFVVERRAVDPRSGYTREVAWVDREHYYTMKVDYYDRKDELLKTLRQLDYAPYAGRFWKPGRLVMVNHQTGKSTEVRWQHYTFGNKLVESDFDPQRLSSAW